MKVCGRISRQYFSFHLRRIFYLTKSLKYFIKMLPRFPPKQEFKNLNKKLIANSIKMKEEVTSPQSLDSQIDNQVLGQFAPSSFKAEQFKPKEQHFSFTVNALDSENVLRERFAELYVEIPDSADVSIMCGKGYSILKAHRYVLMFGSVYFRGSLEVSPCKNPIVMVKNISVEIMGRLLEFMYLGRVTVKSESEFQQFVSAAKYLQVNGIQDDHYLVSN